jgi:hypothetical protein
MILPPEIALRLGGISKLRDAGSFYDVQEFSNAAVWIQVTAHFQEYQGDAIRAIWSTVKDFLIPGEPRRGSVYPGDPPIYMTVFPDSN